MALTTFIEHTDQDIAEMRQWRVQAQKQWGEIANRLGSFVEDIVAPNIPRIGKELLGIEWTTGGVVGGAAIARVAPAGSIQGARIRLCLCYPPRLANRGIKK